MVRLAMQAGALSFVSKSAEIDELLESLKSTASGQRYLPAALSNLYNVETEAVTEEARDPLALLSVRERQIFHLLADGLQNAVIAKQLFISPRTVETHRARVVRKLGLSSNAQLIRFAIRHGLSIV
jgi:DNA-binding NarL/FixJ family response regulator